MISPVFLPSHSQAKALMDEHGSPLFVTDKATLINRVHAFREAFSSNTKIFYALKANANPHVLMALKEAGIDGVDTVSPFEIELAKRAGFTPAQIIFTGNGSSDEELKAVIKHEVLPNIGSISELERLGRLCPGSEVSIRLNPGMGDGENKHVITAGQDSKFGVIQRDFAIARALLEKFDLKLKGLHCHIGSGFYEMDVFRKAIRSILDQALQFQGLDFIDFGGGFGVRYAMDQKPIAIESFGRSIQEMIHAFEKENGKPIEVRFEPGKFLVAESTVLLAEVTTRKSTQTHDFVCVNTGFHHLIRPALYGSHHEMINLSRPDADPEKVTVVGNVCESTDVFGDDVNMADPHEGDIVAFVTAGAYGASMSSLYNLRPYAAEVMLDEGQSRLTRQSPTFDQMWQGLGFTPFE